MRLGMIGPGRMGANRVRRPQKSGPDGVVYDVHAAAERMLAGEGATGRGDAGRILSAMRFGLDGHRERPAEKERKSG
jgi:6-phosphogluconate dehydrogenase